jgi:6-phosphogluconolactonase
MTKLEMDSNEVLLVASRGEQTQHGLWLWKYRCDKWQGRQIDTVRQLSALTGHPHLPVVYGTAGVGQEGTLHSWKIDRNGEIPLSSKSSQGAEPCHLVVDPSGKLLIATNYTSSTLALQRLGPDGSFEGPVDLVKLSGSGPEVERQDDAHPHQAFFINDTLIIIDLGADLVREFRVDLSESGVCNIKEIGRTQMPAGSGPRHGVVLPDGRLAISGELGENLLTGYRSHEEDQWENVRSTLITSLAITRWSRNYPGDIRRSGDGRYIYFANRSHNTISTFDVTKTLPTLVAEIDVTVNWPQHILVRPQHLLIAGWDSSRVVALSLNDGIPHGVVDLFECDGAGWLHVHRLD